MMLNLYSTYSRGNYFAISKPSRVQVTKGPNGKRNSAIVKIRLMKATP
jgi:hypothetical protein